MPEIIQENIVPVETVNETAVVNTPEVAVDITSDLDPVQKPKPNPYVIGVHKNLVSFYGEENVPSLDIFTEKIKNPKYQYGIRENLIHAYGPSSVPDYRAFADSLNLVMPEEKKNLVGTGGTALPPTELGLPSTQNKIENNIPAVINENDGTIKIDETQNPLFLLRETKDIYKYNVADKNKIDKYLNDKGVPSEFKFAYKELGPNYFDQTPDPEIPGEKIGAYANDEKILSDLQRSPIQATKRINLSLFADKIMDGYSQLWNNWEQIQPTDDKEQNRNEEYYDASAIQRIVNNLSSSQNSNKGIYGNERVWYNLQNDAENGFNLINKYIREPEEKKVATKALINATSDFFGSDDEMKEYSYNPLGKNLNIYQSIGLNYLRKTKNPQAEFFDKYKDTDENSLEPTMLTGYETQAKQLEELGISIHLQWCEKQLKELENKFEQGTADEEDLYKYKDIKNSANDALKNLNEVIPTKYPNVIDKNEAEIAQDFLGTGSGIAVTGLKKLGSSTAKTGLGIYDLMAYPFRSQEEVDNAALAASGFEQFSEANTMNTPEARALKTGTTSFSPELLAEMNKIKNSNLPDDEKNYAVRDLLRTNQDKYVYTPPDAGYNWGIKMIAASTTNFASELTPFIVSTLGTGLLTGGTGAAARFANLFSNVLMNSYEQEIARATIENNPNPQSYALGNIMVNSLAYEAAGVATNSVKYIRGAAAKMGGLPERVISKLDDATITKMLQNPPSKLKTFFTDLGKTAINKVGEGAKNAAIFEAFMGAKEAAEGKDFDLAQHGLNMLNFALFHTVAGTFGEMYNLNRAKKNNLYLAALNKDEVIYQAEKALAENKIDKSKYNQIVKNVEAARRVLEKVPMVDENGKKLNDTESAELLYLKIKDQYLLDSMKKDIPENLKKKLEKQWWNNQEQINNIVKRGDYSDAGAPFEGLAEGTMKTGETQQEITNRINRIQQIEKVVNNHNAIVEEKGRGPLSSEALKRYSEELDKLKIQQEKSDKAAEEQVKTTEPTVAEDQTQTVGAVNLGAAGTPTSEIPGTEAAIIPTPIPTAETPSETKPGVEITSGNEPTEFIPEVTVEGTKQGYQVLSGNKENAVGDIFRQEASEARAAGKKSFTKVTVKDGKKTFTLVDATASDDFGRPGFKSASITLPEGTKLTIEDVMPALEAGLKGEKINPIKIGEKAEVAPTEVIEPIEEQNPVKKENINIKNILDEKGNINTYSLKAAIVDAPALINVSEKTIENTIGHLRQIANKINDKELNDTIAYLEDASNMLLSIKNMEEGKRNEFLSNQENFYSDKKPPSEVLKRLDDWAKVLKGNTAKNNAERLLKEQYQQVLGEIERRFVNEKQQPNRPELLEAPVEVKATEVIEPVVENKPVEEGEQAAIGGKLKIEAETPESNVLGTEKKGKINEEDINVEEPQEEKPLKTKKDVQISKQALGDNYNFSAEFDKKGADAVAVDVLEKVGEKAKKNGNDIKTQRAIDVNEMYETDPEPTEYNIITAGSHLLEIDNRIAKAQESGNLAEVENLTEQRNKTLLVLRRLGNKAGRNLALFNLSFLVEGEGDRSEIKLTRDHLKRVLNVDEVPETISELDKSNLTAQQKKTVRPFVEKIEKAKNDYDAIQKEVKDNITQIDEQEINSLIEEARAQGRKQGFQEGVESATPEEKKKKSQKIRDFASKLRASDEYDKLLKKDDRNIEKMGLDFGSYKEIVANVLDAVAKAVELGENVTEAIKKAVDKFKDIDKAKLIADVKTIISTSELPNKKEAIDKIIKIAKKESANNVTKSMVGLVKDVVNSYLGEDLPSNEIIDAATKDLQSILPNVTKADVANAYADRGQFKKEAKENIENRITKRKADIKRLATKEARLNALEAADDYHSQETNQGKKQVRSEYETELDNKIKNLLKQKSDVQQSQKTSKTPKTEQDKIDTINEEIEYVKQTKSVYQQAIKNPVKASEQLVAAREERQQTYSSLGLKLEKQSKTPILIERNYQDAIKELDSRTDLTEEEKNNRKAELKGARDLELQGTKQGVIGSLSDDINEFINENGDKTDLNNNLQDILNGLNPTGEKLDDQIVKAYNKLDELSKNKNLSKEDLAVINELKTNLENNNQLAADKIAAKRLKKQWQNQIKTAETDIASGNFSKLKATPYDYRRDYELLRLENARKNKTGQYKRLVSDAKEKNRGFFEKALDFSNKLLVAGVHTAGKVAELASVKPLLDSMIDMTVGKISSLVTGAPYRGWYSVKKGLKTFGAFKNKENAQKYISKLRTAKEAALENLELAHYNGNESDIAKATKEFKKADLEYAVSTLYLSIEANSLSSFWDYVAHGATDYDVNIGKSTKKDISDYRTTLGKTAYIMDGWVRMHSAMKSSISARPEMMRTFASTLQQFQNKGMELNPENISTAMVLAADAYEQGRLTNQNALSKIISRGKGSQESAGTRLLTKFLFPVSTIGVNLFKQGLDFTTGGIEGWTRLANETKKGMKLNKVEGETYDNLFSAIKGGWNKIPLKERVYIDGVIKRGLFGTALMLATIYGLKNGNVKYGGTYDDQKKRKIMGSDGKPLEPGEWEFFGKRVPKAGGLFLNHLPQFLSVSMVANKYQISKMGGNFNDQYKAFIDEVEARLPFQTLAGVLNPDKGLNVITDRLTRNPLAIEAGTALDEKAKYRDRSDFLNRIRSNMGFGAFNPTKKQQASINKVYEKVKKIPIEKQTPEFKEKINKIIEVIKNTDYKELEVENALKKAETQPKQ